MMKWKKYKLPKWKKKISTCNSKRPVRGGVHATFEWHICNMKRWLHYVKMNKAFGLLKNKSRAHVNKLVLAYLKAKHNVGVAGKNKVDKLKAAHLATKVYTATRKTLKAWKIREATLNKARMLATKKHRWAKRLQRIIARKGNRKVNFAGRLQKKFNGIYAARTGIAGKVSTNATKKWLAAKKALALAKKEFRTATRVRIAAWKSYRLAGKQHLIAIKRIYASLAEAKR